MVEHLKTSYSVAWIDHIAQVPQAEWDALAMALNTPFFEWEWLHNMETSGSATAQAGWMPYHLTVWRDRRLVAAAPLYVKGHSYGEFVFDHQWADLATRLGIEYYPKLLGMSPFTPAEGYRFLIDPTEDEDELTELMVSAIDHFCDRNRISGCNFLYADPAWKTVMERHGFTTWVHHSYIWQNQGYQTFDDYLNAFNANQRRNIKRERKAVGTAGLTLKTFTGEEIPKSLFSLMYHYYSDTCDKFGWWGSKYLTRKFFEQLHPTYAHRVLFVAAYSEQDPRQPMGMSFCLTKGQNLYGRYWGSSQEIDCLHFDACYYTPIEWAIAHGIQTFDPGAGGRHKKRRGFPATPNYSLHRFYNPRLTQILRSYIQEVNDLEQQEMEAINQALPFKQSDPERS
ncbi:MAG: GNAT family N-acetyltransferase [Leptolyngbyaceae cyanobacterium bins.349]|nr:GNAT family N-acetyltransferase [Leptolyngbyaceae cyanobacterium bins.349]